MLNGHKHIDTEHTHYYNGKNGSCFRLEVFTLTVITYRIKWTKAMR